MDYSITEFSFRLQLIPYKEIADATQLINELENLHQKGYSFRGHANAAFFLEPSAFRANVIKERLNKFPITLLYKKWCTSSEIIKLIKLYLNEAHIKSLHVKRICEVAFYKMHYNYFLAMHVEKDKQNFEENTIEFYNIRPKEHWIREETFISLIQFDLNTSLTRITDSGQIINLGRINKEMAGYNESLPQHYSTATGSLDFSKDFYVAIAFALKDIPSNASHITVYAYKELDSLDKNPFSILENNPNKNLRMDRQKGCLISMKYACLYYHVHGRWPSMETFFSNKKNLFDLVRFDISISEALKLRKFLDTEKYSMEYLYGLED